MSGSSFCTLDVSATTTVEPDAAWAPATWLGTNVPSPTIRLALIASAAALREALMRRVARMGPLSATIGHLRSESHHQRREQADFIPLRIGPVKYAVSRYAALSP